MGFLTSPGIQVNETDLSTSVPAVATTVGAIAGVFDWGPVNDPTLISNEEQLKARFGKPTSRNYETWFTAADFLSYTGALWVTRAVGTGAVNAGATTVVNDAAAAAAISTVPFVARYPGILGNSIEVTVANSVSYSVSDIEGFAMTAGANTASATSTGGTVVGDIIRLGDARSGYQNLKVTAVSGGTITFDQRLKLLTTPPPNPTRYWGGFNAIATRPGTGRVHILVIDRAGEISGVPGTVLEAWPNLSVVNGTMSDDGASLFYADVINTKSRYIWSTGSAVLATGASTYLRLTGGADGANESTISIADLAKGYDTFREKSAISFSLLMAGKPQGVTMDEYLITLAEHRKDCVAFLSPRRDLVIGNPGDEAEDVAAYARTLTPSSYAFMDSGYKYRYDKYNDKYVYTPLNGDIAGLVARTDMTRDPWIAPAGYNRGVIKNAIRLAFNPNQAERDLLYAANVNPVISEAGEGVLLYGDKTMYGDGSAFSRIGVRRLFIVLRHAIERSLKKTLWEQNDEFSRSAYKNMVDPFLRDIQGRRGIVAFKNVCDTTNNTPEVIDRNEFVADIYIKPSRSINFIQLKSNCCQNWC